MQRITQKAYAKINIGLDVLRRREDGYHEVRMIMQTVDICDNLILERTAKPGILILTDKEELPVNQDNLIYKAADLLMKKKNTNQNAKRFKKNLSSLQRAFLSLCISQTIANNALKT